MNTHWTKEDINQVITQLHQSPFTSHKGQMFFKVGQKEQSPLMAQLYEICELSGKGLSIGVKPNGIQPDANEKFSDELKFILKHANGSMEQIDIAVFTTMLFDENHTNYLPFVIAHELAHIAYGDIKENNQVRYEDPEFLKREVRADLFACRVLCDNSHGISALKLIRLGYERMNKLTRELMGEENYKTIIFNLNTRISAMENMVLECEV